MTPTKTQGAPEKQTSQSDEDLWQQYTEGADQAFNELRSRYRDDIFRYLLLSGLPAREAAQMLGQIWCHLASHCQNPTDFISIKSWIFAVATQQFVPAHIPQDRGLMDFVTELKEGDPTTKTEQLKRELSDMQRDVRQPFLLASTFGLTVEETAQACRFSSEETENKIELGFRRLSKNDFLFEE